MNPELFAKLVRFIEGGPELDDAEMNIVLTQIALGGNPIRDAIKFVAAGKTADEKRKIFGSLRQRMTIPLN